MDKKDEALKLALEALQKCDSALAEELAAWDIDPPLHHVQEASNACGPAITAIREALAEQPAQQQEPFCYHDGHDIVGKEFADHSDVFPLYTSPQPSQSRSDVKPLTWPAEQPAPPPWWPAVENIMNEYGLQAIDFVADFKAALADHIGDVNKMVEQPVPPPECQTEAEKTAFAFGWWKALEMHRTPAQQQEPVYLVWMKSHCAWMHTDKDGFDKTDPEERWMLYTSPPASKPWVGLTDEERDAILDREFKQWWSRHNAVCRAIEAKLKEKNA